MAVPFSPVLLCFFFKCWFIQVALSESYYHRAFPIIEPDNGHTKLSLAEEGLDVISRLENPIAIIAVIGPYRSGKSFLLNQLLSLSCEEGFGVGHMRETKTKGIWVWGAPVELDVEGARTSVLFLDTEGFESIGKSNVYDDRIFALATIMSSVLIYNLPETVREADISRLSFAVELAQEFYGRVKGPDVAFQPARLLWLIQRDFLEGKTVQQMVNEALQLVPNHSGNKNIEQVNQIRESLAIMGENNTAFSLPQPHLMRTKLCNLNDSDLEASYVTRREELKALIKTLVKPKVVQGKYLNGKQFVSFLEQIIDALNKGDIPSTVSLVEVFNKGVIDQCLKLYSDLMLHVRFPLSEGLLRNAHGESKGKAMAMFEEKRFGRHHVKSSRDILESEIQKIYANLVLKNEYTSAKMCEALYTSCEEKMDELQDLRLPSMSKFNAGFVECNRTFNEACQGPSKIVYEKRIEKMLVRSRLQFIKDYNNRLFNWLVGFSLAMVVVGRFVLKFFLIEVAAWGMFIFLQTYTRVFWSSESLYYNPLWNLIVRVWESLVYSPILDLDRWAIPLAWLSLILLLLWRCYGRRKCAGTSLLPLYTFQVGNSNPRNRRSD